VGTGRPETERVQGVGVARKYLCYLFGKLQDAKRIAMRMKIKGKGKVVPVLN
jgi:hypothetical protein